MTPTIQIDPDPPAAQPAPATAEPVTLPDVMAAARPLGGFAIVQDNWAAKLENDQWASWDKSLQSGRDYLCGSQMPMRDFLRTHTSALTAWQKVAYAFARRWPDKMLQIEFRRLKREWHVYQRGQYVCFDLPHHDWGGEKGYISRDGRTKVHVNED